MGKLVLLYLEGAMCVMVCMCRSEDSLQESLLCFHLGRWGLATSALTL